jgi:uncharacterized protein YuzE
MAEETPGKIPKGLMYDGEDDILFFSKGKASKGTIEIGDFVIDIDENGNLTAIEIFNASKIFNVQKKILSVIKSAKLRIQSTPNAMYLSMAIVLMNGKMEFPPISLLPHAARREPIVSSPWTEYIQIAV